MELNINIIILPINILFTHIIDTTNNICVLILTCMCVAKDSHTVQNCPPRENCKGSVLPSILWARRCANSTNEHTVARQRSEKHTHHTFTGAPLLCSRSPAWSTYSHPFQWLIFPVFKGFILRPQLWFKHHLTFVAIAFKVVMELLNWLESQDSYLFLYEKTEKHTHMKWLERKEKGKKSRVYYWNLIS